jgi:hypothetical protein
VKYCACGCNKIVKPGNTYINGHNKPTLGKQSKFKGKSYAERFGKDRSDEISQKIRITKIGDNNPAKRPDIKKIISKNRRGKLKGDSNPKYWKGKENPGQSERMKQSNPLFDSKTKEKRRIFLLNKFFKTGDVKIGNNETQILNEIEKILNIKIEPDKQNVGKE